MNTDSYVDNNGSIRVCVDQLDTSLSVGQTQTIYLALDNISQLPAEPTVFVNRLRFSVNTISPAGGSTNYFVGHMMAGIVPLSLVTGTDFNSLDSFETIKGWPLPMSKKYLLNGSGHAAASDTPWVGKLSHTYNPKSTLLINREQCIVLTFTNDYGDQQDCNITIEASLNRGD